MNVNLILFIMLLLKKNANLNTIRNIYKCVKQEAKQNFS